MSDVSIMHIRPVTNPTGIYLLVIETDNWASCEVVGKDTDYEIKVPTTYAWSDSISGEPHKVASFKASTVNDIPLKNFWLIK